MADEFVDQAKQQRSISSQHLRKLFLESFSRHSQQLRNLLLSDTACPYQKTTDQQHNWLYHKSDQELFDSVVMTLKIDSGCRCDRSHDYLKAFLEHPVLASFSPLLDRGRGICLYLCQHGYAELLASAKRLLEIDSLVETHPDLLADTVAEFLRIGEKPDQEVIHALLAEGYRPEEVPEKILRNPVTLALSGPIPSQTRILMFLKRLIGGRNLGIAEGNHLGSRP
jgi:hypothetical protein